MVELIGKNDWSSMSAGVKGDAYEGLLERNAQDVKGGAGRYYTPPPSSTRQHLPTCVPIALEDAKAIRRI